MPRKARKRKKRSPHQKLKKETSDWMSRYIRLRDALHYHLILDGAYPRGYAMCYTCSTTEHVKYMQAGHFKTRGLGGHSGIYFDERGVHTQCVQCNGFRGGCPEEYERRLRQDYSADVVDELKTKHKLPGGYTTAKLTKLLIYFQLETQKLLKQLNMEPWW